MTNKEVAQKKKITKHPKIREAERQKELEEKKKQLQCFKCGKEIPLNHPRKKDQHGRLTGRCLHKSKGGCQRKTYFVTMEELAESEFKPAKEIIKDEDKKIKNYLEDPALLIKTVKEVQKEVAGEEDTILSIIIFATARLVKNAIPESTNLLLSDKTGLGKDWVTKKTLEVIIPEKDNCHVTKMTPEAFTYWHYKDKDWSWDNKVIHFEDVTQILLNCSTFKAMASGDNFAVVVKDQQTLEIPINGKPCMILTSHHANPKDEALRRFRIGSLNDSNIQTRNILNKISRKYTGIDNTTIDYFLRRAVQNLKSFEVVIPFAEIIQYFFPDDDIMRTHYHCFLDYVCASTIFHQKQRKQTEDKKLIANIDDYMIARLVLIYTTSNPKMIPLSKEYRDVIKLLEEFGELTVRELEQKCTFSLQWLYKHIPNIVATGLIEKGSKYNERANKEVTTYKYTELTAKMIPTWIELSNQIYDIINKTNKTNKTEAYQRLEKWFSTVNIKPIKPDCIKEELSLVFYDHIIPFNREVLTVFPVLCAFLKESDEERYKKYYEESKIDTINTNIENYNLEEKTLSNELHELKGFCEKLKKNGNNITYEVLCFSFDKTFIEKCKENKILIPLPNGSYDFAGGN